jgi:16S rRNA (uracil1498-N3)-methyltransferase
LSLFFLKTGALAATREAVEAVRPGESIGIFIGPEGGFAPEEIEAVKGEMKLISLGSRILRTETAGFTTLAILMYHIETSCPEKYNFYMKDLSYAQT